VYDDVNDTCTYCSRRGLPCSEKELTRPQQQKPTQETEPHSTTATFDVPFSSSIDSSAVRTSREPFVDAASVPPIASPETGPQSILSILSGQQEMLREWAIKLHSVICEVRDSTHGVPDGYWEFLPPRLAEILGHGGSDEIDFNDTNEWSLRLGFLILGCDSEDDLELRDIVLGIVEYLLENCGHAYGRLTGSFSFLKLISEEMNFKDASSPIGARYSPFFYIDSKELFLLSGESTYTFSDRVPQIPVSQSFSWIGRCITRVNSAIRTANESVDIAGKAITTAFNLFSSLGSLSVGTRDTSLEGLYISELILHVNSLDLKGAWSSVSEVWSKFMNNIGRMLSGLKVPAQDGFLGNYPIHIV
jgi:hypothetical protein